MWPHALVGREVGGEIFVTGGMRGPEMWVEHQLLIDGSTIALTEVLGRVESFMWQVISL